MPIVLKGYIKLNISLYHLKIRHFKILDIFIHFCQVIKYFINFY